MLSKAEIQYLQGKKAVSKSYERKLKCLIKKKIDVLGMEIPLLSKLFVEILELSVPTHDSDTKAGRANRTAKEDSHEANSSQCLHSSPATEFSNAESNDVEIDTREVMRSQNFKKILHSIKDKLNHATEFGNVPCNGATKNSNHYEIHDIELNPINISLSGALEQKNFNISNQTSLLSEWAGSDAGHICL